MHIDRTVSASGGSSLSFQDLIQCILRMLYKRLLMCFDGLGFIILLSESVPGKDEFLPSGGGSV